MAAPTLRLERRILREGARHVACVDEVGRGAIAGPVAVGVVLVSRESGRPPSGIRDSKLLTPASRERLRPRIEAWAADVAVGHATPLEIDRDGIVTAMRLATMRALEELDCVPDAILLDGSHDYLSPRGQGTLFGEAENHDLPPVTLIVRGDQRCVGVAAASIMAKCMRDDTMRQLALAHPAYEWDQNKGYGTRSHLEAIGIHGLTTHHRRSWRIEVPT
jgi:ribonuclease HII